MLILSAKDAAANPEPSLSRRKDANSQQIAGDPTKPRKSIKKEGC